MKTQARNTMLGAALAASACFAANAALTPIVIYDAADGVGVDSSGAGNDGAATGVGVTVVASGPNAGDMSYSFAGGADTSRINTNAIDLLNNADIIAAGGFTMSAWINTDGTGSGTSASIIDYAGTERIQFNPNTGALSFAVDGIATGVDSSVNVLDGQWHFVVAEFVLTDGSNPALLVGDLRLTVDGTTDTASGATISTFGDGLDRPIGIGGHPIGFVGDIYGGLINDATVSLGVVPEPGSLALLGLGGLMIARRRRA